MSRDTRDRGVPAAEAHLLEQARSGDVEAFGRLVELHQDYIHNAVYHLLGSREDAADVAQEVFMRAYDKLQGFQGRARFGTWVYGIMLNCVRNHWRRGKRRWTLSLDGPGADDGTPHLDPSDPADGPLESVMQSERVRMVRAAIARLDEGLREILVLRDIEGLSYEELSEVLELEAGTVKSRLHRAREALRRGLEPYYGQSEAAGAAPAV